MIGGEGLAHVHGAIPELVVLGSIRKQVGHATESKQATKCMYVHVHTQTHKHTPWPLHQLMLLGSCLAWVPVLTSFSDKQWYGSLTQINPFLPRLLLVMVFYHSSKNITKKKKEKNITKTETGTRIVEYCCDRPDHIVSVRIVERL